MTPKIQFKFKPEQQREDEPTWSDISIIPDISGRNNIDRSAGFFIPISNYKGLGISGEGGMEYDNDGGEEYKSVNVGINANYGPFSLGGNLEKSKYGLTKKFQGEFNYGPINFGTSYTASPSNNRFLAKAGFRNNGWNGNITYRRTVSPYYKLNDIRLSGGYNNKNWGINGNLNLFPILNKTLNYSSPIISVNGHVNF